MLALLVAPLATAVAARLGRLPDEIAPLIGPPAKGQGADLVLPCFQLAKSAKGNPAQLAADLATLQVPGMALSAAGPFLNVALQPATVAGVLLPVLASDPLLCLRRDHGEGKTVCIDYSSPNIAKHLAFHHIRSTMIGNALARLYGACGWRVVRINFLGDWGTAFGRLISAWHREGLTLAQLDAAPDRVTFLNELYVRASQAEKADPAKEAESRRWSKALEDGDAAARQLWQIFKDASLAEFQRIYAMLGVGFDSWKGEAFYEDKMGAVLGELESRGLTKVDQGATVVDLSELGLKKPMLLRRADGGSLYATRDLAACDDRWKEYAFDRSLYVVDLGQALHFKEWFACSALLGRAYADRLRHIGFGIVLLWNDEPGEGLEPGWARGRTRGGKVMLLREVLEESVDRARTVIAEKNPGIEGDERERIARAVGVGAVVFNDLKNARTNDVKFRFEEALRFDGETGPYLQFAHARLCSIERKFRETFPHAPAGDPARIARDDEKAVLIAIARLAGALDRAVDQDEPSQLAQALLALAAAVSAWLTAGSKDDSARVLVEDPVLAASRLRVVRAARAALGEGLRLLGLEAPERM